LANIKSAIKRIRSSARKQQNNRILRGRARTAVKKARLTLSEGKPEDAQTAVKQAISELDRAAGKGVIHKNNAARRKARLMKQLIQSQQPK
jgi:small subunit ribosomal protein S20